MPRLTIRDAILLRGSAAVRIDDATRVSGDTDRAWSASVIPNGGLSSLSTFCASRPSAGSASAILRPVNSCLPVAISSGVLMIGLRLPIRAIPDLSSVDSRLGPVRIISLIDSIGRSSFVR